LFLSGAAKWFGKSEDVRFKKLAEKFIDIVKSTRSPGYEEWCWGYNFDWQSKAFFQPKFTPTVVATSFVANAFLDAYQIWKEKEYLDIARSSADFVTNRLNRTVDGDTICFSYSPLDKTQVYNATALGSRLLARIFSVTSEPTLYEAAEKSIRFLVDHQNLDGSWFYGSADHQRWIDNFHTGFILESLHDFAAFTNDSHVLDSLQRGYAFYKKNFLSGDTIPKCYHDSTYPIDVHSVAQSIVTFARLGDVDLAKRVAEWAGENMQSKQGYYYYQKQRYYTNRIPYMRWSQSWMFYALAILLNYFSGENEATSRG
jgi:hypothetical protein